MEFKGTKGDWIAQKLDDTFIVNDQGKHVLCIEHNGCYDYNELPYNAQLIACAPEMLGMLKSLIDNPSFLGHLPETSLKVKELIKKATTV